MQDLMLLYSGIFYLAMLVAFSAALLSATYITWRDVKSSRIVIYAQIALAAAAMTAQTLVGLQASWYLPVTIAGLALNYVFIARVHQYWEETFSSQFRTILYGTMVIPASAFFGVRWASKTLRRLTTA